MSPERWLRIDEVFRQALSLPPENLDSYLKQACAEDEELRREVESLLAHERQAGTFLDSPLQTRTDFGARSLLHYRILEKIGEGGMGVVYRAHDTKLDRDVAIKILPDEFAVDRERLARFAREARLLAMLNHPNIAAIHGFEEAGDTHFLILELVDGKTLAEKLRKGRLPLEDTLDICHQIADGLEAAHEMGVVHRDLKPANIQLMGSRKVKILDFGLAKAVYGQPRISESSRFATDESQATAAGDD